MHSLIVGMPQSGKTSLAKYFAMQAANRGENVTVFDPLKQTGWPRNCNMFNTPEVFLDRIWNITSTHVFMDECKMLFDADKKQAEKLAYMGRHGGRLLYFIGTRANSMIPPNARNTCSKVFAFKQGFQDSDILAKNYNEKFIDCQGLKELQFLAGDPFRMYRGQITFINNQTHVEMTNYE